MRTHAWNRPPMAATRLLRRPRVLVVGCGDIGLRIVARLAGRARVTGVVSSPEGAARVRAAGARALVADLDIAPGRRRRLPPATRLIHLAPTSKSGTTDQRLLRVLREAGPHGRMVYVSTTGVYGDRGGDWVDETATPRPRNARAVRRLAAERAARSGPRHASVLRAPGIYAADRLPLERLRARVPALVAGQDIHTNHIHAEDLARACLQALARGARARVYNVVDDTQMLLGDYLDLVADTFGLERPPRSTADVIASQVDAARLSFLTESRRILNARLHAELGLRLSFADVRAGLRDALLAAQAAAKADSGDTASPARGAAGDDQAGKRLSTER